MPLAAKARRLRRAGGHDIQRAVGSRTFAITAWPLATRVGISTGSVIGGSVARGQRMSYTLLGDTVNLARGWRS